MLRGEWHALYAKAREETDEKVADDRLSQRDVSDDMDAFDEKCGTSWRRGWLPKSAGSQRAEKHRKAACRADCADDDVGLTALCRTLCDGDGRPPIGLVVGHGWYSERSIADATGRPVAHRDSLFQRGAAKVVLVMGCGKVLASFSLNATAVGFVEALQQCQL